MALKDIQCNITGGKEEAGKTDPFIKYFYTAEETRKAQSWHCAGTLTPSWADLEELYYNATVKQLLNVTPCPFHFVATEWGRVIG